MPIPVDAWHRLFRSHSLGLGTPRRHRVAGHWSGADVHAHACRAGTGRCLVEGEHDRAPAAQWRRARARKRRRNRPLLPWRKMTPRRVPPSTRTGEGMTRTTNARLAGFTYLVYMGVGISNEVLMARAKGAEGVAAKLARIAEHTTEVRVATVLAVLECLSALVLGVALYGVTREVDH